MYLHLQQNIAQRPYTQMFTGNEHPPMQSSIVRQKCFFETPGSFRLLLRSWRQWRWPLFLKYGISYSHSKSRMGRFTDETRGASWCVELLPGRL